MFDIIASLFESMVSFLQNLISFVGFIMENVEIIFEVFNYIPSVLQAPVIMAVTIMITLGIKKAVLA